jgi:hypothetical protein
VRARHGARTCTPLPEQHDACARQSANTPACTARAGALATPHATECSHHLPARRTTAPPTLDWAVSPLRRFATPASLRYTRALGGARTRRESAIGRAANTDASDEQYDYRTTEQILRDRESGLAAEAEVRSATRTSE